MQLKFRPFSWLFKKQKTADDYQRADKSCGDLEQRGRKKGQSSFKKLIKCLEDVEEPVTLKANAQDLIRPIPVDNGCFREDSRIRDWLLDSARFATPPATPHGDPSQQNSAASEAAFSKATTASQPCPCPDDREEPRPVLAKHVGQAAQPPKPREQEHEVLFSRRAAPPPGNAAGSRPRSDIPPAAVGDAAATALGDMAPRGAAATAATTPPKAKAPGEGWERWLWPESLSLGLLASSPAACTQARRFPAPTSP